VTLSIASRFLSAHDPSAFARRALDFHPDPAQQQILASGHPRRILCCSRQWGKSTVAAILAVHQLVFGPPGNLTLVLAPSLRQSAELVRKMNAFLRRLRIHPRGDGENHPSILMPNGSRVVGLPGKSPHTRGFSAVGLLIIDEAARVSDLAYFALRPVLAVSTGSELRVWGRLQPAADFSPPLEFHPWSVARASARRGTSVPHRPKAGSELWPMVVWPQLPFGLLP
jgi:hypothetical protein